MLPLKPVTGPHFLSLCQIWCESVQKWPSQCRLTGFKMVASTILDFWPMWILTVNLAAWSSFQPTYEIWSKYMQKWPTYGQNCDFQPGSRHHLGFCKISILPVKPVTRPRFLSLHQTWWESVPLSYLASPLPMFPLEFRGEINHAETGVMGLLSGESCKKNFLTSTVFDWSTRVTVRQTDGR